jgi:hypothetical protein
VSIPTILKLGRTPHRPLGALHEISTPLKGEEIRRTIRKATQSGLALLDRTLEMKLILNILKMQQNSCGRLFYEISACEKDGA